MNDKTTIAFLLFILIGLPTLIYATIQQDNKFEVACKAKGGEVLWTRNMTYCVKKGTVL